MSDRSRLRQHLVRFGPWVLTAIVLAAILRKYPLGEILHAMAEGRAWPLPLVAMTFAVVHMIVVASWDTLVLHSVLGGPRWVDVARVKSGCAVLQSIGYVLNQGAYGTWIARATRSGPRVAVALILFTASSDFAAGALVATGSVHLAQVRVPELIRWGAPIGFVLVTALLLAPRRVPLPTSGASVLEVFRAVPRGRGALQLFGRMINVGLISVAAWAAANAFGLALPLRAAITYVPLIMLVGSLPVNVFGFGPVQGMWLLFTPWVSGPRILAFQILWNLSLILANVLRGVAFVPRILREVAEGSAPVSERVL